MAELTDIEPVLAIEQAVFRDPWSATAFRALPGDPRVYFACVRRGAAAGAPDVNDSAEERAVCDLTHVLGYVVAMFAADEGEIANLAILPTVQGMGIGGQLLDAVVAEAMRRRCAALYLEVRESNTPARRLYTSRGFTEVGRRLRYYQNPVEDALLLRRLA